MVSDTTTIKEKFEEFKESCFSIIKSWRNKHSPWTMIKALNNEQTTGHRIFLNDVLFDQRVIFNDDMARYTLSLIKNSFGWNDLGSLKYLGSVRPHNEISDYMEILYIRFNLVEDRHGINMHMTIWRENKLENELGWGE